MKINLQEMDELIAMASGDELAPIAPIKDRTSDLEARAKVSAKLDDFEKAYMDLSGIVSELTPEFVGALDGVKTALDDLSNTVAGKAPQEPQQDEIIDQVDFEQKDVDLADDEEDREPIDFDDEAELHLTQQDESLDDVDKLYKDTISLLKEVKKMTFKLKAPTNLDSNKLKKLENLLGSVQANIKKK